MLVERHFPHLPIRNFNLSYPYQTVAAFLPSTYGAGDENWTHNISLEDWNFTIKLHPHLQSALIVACFRNVVLKRLLRHFKNKMLLKISAQTFLFKFAVASYGRHSRIWTRDPLLPRQVRYQAALYAVKPVWGKWTRTTIPRVKVLFPTFRRYLNLESCKGIEPLNVGFADQCLPQLG